ncbi:MAG: GUN4 domain-containing protein [Okeania sp. SIO3I5]|uniref:GUN4 domain-containing protein n=1 Tax=Okeania sp. SIO3I5 TaxID=2607805 RepID=UPI0013B9DAB8|nr:GUN4 domain-containing protein [Okeania sp. SIO3I5]NEQ36513.1 GUN4 domain-containing protein [Okeania sp. SIO3I5]
MTNKFSQLQNLLVVKNWQEADRETRRIMLKIAGAEQRDNLLLTQKDIEKFPCNDLIIIDRLWLKYSQKRFGFSMINNIYQKVQRNYAQLAEIVGWRIGDRWLNYDNIIFDINAPVGHLPVSWLVPTTFGMYWQARFARVG